MRFISAASEYDSKGVHVFNEDGEDGIRAILLGPLVSIRKHVEGLGNLIPEDLVATYQSVVSTGDEALFVCDGGRAIGLVHLSKKTFDPRQDSIVQLRELGLKLRPLDKDTSPQAAVMEARAEGCLVAFVGREAKDLPALDAADLSLSISPGNKDLVESADVTLLSGGYWHFRHLFSLGRELLRLRRILNQIFLGVSAVIAFALLPFACVVFFKQRELLSYVNPIGFESLPSAIFSFALASWFTLAIVGLSVLGLHEHRGRFFRFGRGVFTHAGFAKAIIATLVFAKGADYFLTLFLN